MITRRLIAQTALGLAAMAARAAPPGLPSGPASPFTAPAGGGLTTRVGRLGFHQGYPDAATTRLLYDNLDFQRAVQAYIWALPITGFAQWQAQHRVVFQATDTDLVVYTSFRDKLGLLTANATTPYIVGFHDLARTGPLVISLPAGPTAGGIGDFWQRPMGDYGEGGPDRGQGATILLLGPGQDDPKADGYRVIRSTTNNVLNGFRLLSPDPQAGAALLAQYKIFPYAQRDNPPPSRLLHPDGRPWSGTQPRGMAYWTLLAAILEDEPVQERDRFFMAMLRPLGFIKGKPFAPTPHQRALLTEAALVGEATTRVIDFEKRFEGAAVWPGQHWHLGLFFDPSQRADGYEAFDERATWFYEAVTAATSMAVRQPGPGQVYLGVNKAKDGSWLDGGRSYRLRVPANVPADLFWSVTAYDVETRCFIDTPTQRADRGSRDPLLKQPDGAAEIHFGPQPPKGRDANWVPTSPGRGWFAYFRLYSPRAAFFDKTWQLPDLERVA